MKSYRNFEKKIPMERFYSTISVVFFLFLTGFMIDCVIGFFPFLFRIFAIMFSFVGLFFACVKSIEKTVESSIVKLDITDSENKI